MPTYIFKAVDKNGLIISNKVDENNKIGLIKKIKSNGLYPIEIRQVNYKGITTSNKKKKKNMEDVKEYIKDINTSHLGQDARRTMTTTEKISLYFSSSKKITNRDIVIFTQNFYLLKKADFNNIHALRTIIESTENLNLKGILEDVLAGVESGEHMYSTMEYYSDIFPYIYINMIKVGELSGSLINSLAQAVKYLEDSEKLNKKIRSILLPNIFQFVMLTVMLIVGTLIAIPAIQNVFDEVGTEEELPAITMWFSGVVDKLVMYWYIPLIIIAIIIGLLLYYINTPKGKYNFDYFKYKCPLFGQLIFSLDFTRLMKGMLLNLRNGMRIQDSLTVSKSIVENYVMLSIVETSINNLLIGSSWIEPFEKSGLAKPMTIEMIKTGMQTDLPEMIEKLLDYMQIDIDSIMENIMKALPQITYAIVGVVLIFFVLVVLVPCINVYMGGFLFSAYGV